jgi:hypothetical protein
MSQVALTPASAVLTCSSAVSLSRASVVSTRFDVVGSPALLHAIPPLRGLDL